MEVKIGSPSEICDGVFEESKTDNFSPPETFRRWGGVKRSSTLFTEREVTTHFDIFKNGSIDLTK